VQAKHYLTALVCLGFSTLVVTADDSESKDVSSEAARAVSKDDSSHGDGIESQAVAASQDSPVQSAARPYNLDIVAPVQIAGSDAAAKMFQAEVLPGMLETMNSTLREGKSLNDKKLAAMAFDPSKFVLGSDSTARVYFLGEGAAYHNTLGFSTTGGNPLTPDAALIFPDASSTTAYGELGKALRTSNEPLAVGDFVNLGNFKSGTALDFFLIANGAAGGKDFFSTNKSLNKDGLIHAVSLSANGSTYLLVGFEDMTGGGDRDYNDVAFAVELTSTPPPPGVGAPEPSMAIGALLSVIGLLGFSRSRRA